jgi:hypothetical protein
MCDVISNRTAEHGIPSLQGVEDRALGGLTGNVKLHLSANSCKRSQMRWKNHADHGNL